MYIDTILFYILATLTFVVALTVISVRNPVYSVLSLVILFVCGALLLALLGLDFIPLVFVVVYVGAVAVLFLFVVIILNIKLEGVTFSPVKFLLPFFLVGFFYVSYISSDVFEVFHTNEEWEYITNSLSYLAYLQGPAQKVHRIVPYENWVDFFWTWFLYRIGALSFIKHQLKIPGQARPTDYLDPNINTDWSFYDDISNIDTIGNVIYTHFFVHFLIAGLILLLAIVGAIVLTSQHSRQRKNQLIFRQISRQPRVIWIRS
jgi:NADH:ubiquinone oxidoreductase subunit 6 (subunit J)